MTEPCIYVRGSGTEFAACVPALPGAVGTGTTREDAIANARRAFRAYRELLEARGISTAHWAGIDPDALEAKDAPADLVLPGEELPVEEHELREFLHQLEASRGALIALVRGLSPDQLEAAPTGTTWSVREALEHIMAADLEFIAKLEKWPADPFGALQAAHRIVFQRFSVMEPSDHVDHLIAGRRWTTRKVMRRLLEHEVEHYTQIKELMAGRGGDRPPE